jgi:hypothetical protein
MGARQFALLEGMVNNSFPDCFAPFMTKYAGLSLEEDCYLDAEGRRWIAAAFEDFASMQALTKEFKQKGWGLKVPFAHDEGGWHFCLSFDAKTHGKIVINRWTDHLPEDQFLVIADSFEEFVAALQRRPAELS